MSTVLLPLIPGNLPPGYCFTSWQATLSDFAAALNAQLPGESFYNFGDTKPSPDNNSYPWLRTTDGRWYFFSGSWIAPHPIQSQNVIWLWDGSTLDLQTFDGGDADPLGASSGPMWEVVAAIGGRFPVGVGTIQSSGTVVAVTDTGGDDSASIPTASLPPHSHYVGIDGTTGLATDSQIGTFRTATTNIDFQAATVSNKLGQTRSYGPDFSAATPPTPPPFPTTPPYYGLYFIRRTTRQNYKVP